MDALYSFREAVLVSAMFLRGSTWELDLDSWRAAKEALLFGDELDVLDCEGRSAGQELFIEQLGDKARFTMDKCPGEDLLSLVLGFFTEEDQKLTVEEELHVWQRECSRGDRVPNQRTLPCPTSCGSGLVCRCSHG